MTVLIILSYIIQELYAQIIWPVKLFMFNIFKDYIYYLLYSLDQNDLLAIYNFFWMNVPVTLTSLSAIYNNQRHALKSKTFGKKKVSDTRLVPTF